jgi:hypothetical protein
MIRSGLTTARARTVCRVRFAEIGARRIGITAHPTASSSGTYGKGRRFRVFTAGAVLAGVVATAYTLNAVQVIHNEDPNTDAVDIAGPINTSPLKPSDDGKLRTYIWGSNK